MPCAARREGRARGAVLVGVCGLLLVAGPTLAGSDCARGRGGECSTRREASARADGAAAAAAAAARPCVHGAPRMLRLRGGARPQRSVSTHRVTGPRCAFLPFCWLARARSDSCCRVTPCPVPCAARQAARSAKRAEPFQDEEGTPPRNLRAETDEEPEQDEDPSPAAVRGAAAGLAGAASEQPQDSSVRAAGGRHQGAGDAGFGRKRVLGVDALPGEGSVASTGVRGREGQTVERSGDSGHTAQGAVGDDGSDAEAVGRGEGVPPHGGVAKPQFQFETHGRLKVSFLSSFLS